MASRDVVHYDSPLQRLLRVLAVIFVVLYLVWTLLPFVIMFVSSFKDLLAAFKLPAVGDWLGPSSTTRRCSRRITSAATS
jgi:multiple sugar transport system permease protein